MTMKTAESLYIISLKYTVPVELIDRHMEAHKEFLKKYYAKGNFIVSGRKEPRTGGIIIAKTTDMTALQNIIKEDVFFQKELAEYAITEFKPTTYSEEFTPVMNTLLPE